MSQVISLKTVSNMLTVTKRTPGFDQPAREQAALAEAVAAVAVRTASGSRRRSNASRAFGRRHQRVGLLEDAIEQPRVGGSLRSS